MAFKKLCYEKNENKFVKNSLSKFFLTLAGKVAAAGGACFVLFFLGSFGFSLTQPLKTVVNKSKILASGRRGPAILILGKIRSYSKDSAIVHRLLF